MKRRIVSRCLITVLILILLLQTAYAAIPQNSGHTDAVERAYVAMNANEALGEWESGRWTLSGKQADAYVQILRDAKDRLETTVVYYDQKALYATLVDINGNTMLWVAGMAIADYSMEGVRGYFPFGNGAMYTLFEEIWEWDGSKAVEFEAVSKYGAHVNLWENGIEVFTCYSGTDADGHVWDAFYPLNDDRVSTIPTWCHAWGWVYNYKLEGLNVEGKSKKDVAEIFFKNLISKKEWPNLPFDYGTITTQYEFLQGTFYAEVDGGVGYEEFCADIPDCGLFSSSALQNVSHIVKQDGSWQEADYVIEYLSDLENFDIQYEEDGLVVYSDHVNLRVRKGSTITLNAGIRSGGDMKSDVSGITFQIEDTSILKLFATDVEDEYRHVVLTGLTEGTTAIIFNDSNTGYTVRIPISVYGNDCRSYTLNSVPTQNIEKYPTNFYNINGMYVDSYQYRINDDQSAFVSFDVYNTNYTYGAVEVLDENGIVKDAVLIDKMTSRNTSVKEVLFDGVGYLVSDIIDGDIMTYRNETGYSQRTPVEVEIPKNGYIKIVNDPADSFIVALVNGVDVIMSTSSLAGKIKNYDVGSSDFSKDLTAKLVNNQIYAELIKDGNGFSEKLLKNIGKETFLSSKSMGEFAATITNNIYELELESIIIDTAVDYGWEVGENVFSYFAGPAGKALNIMTIIGKVENILIQQIDIIQTAGFGATYIQNQGGGFRACQQIKVESENDLSYDTALNAFRVTLDEMLVNVNEKANPGDYEAMKKGITYTYNISLVKNQNEVQPNGNVTVYIPIPEDLRFLSYTNDISDKVKIYRVEDNGGLTEMDIKIEEGCFVFTTNHFSLYAIVGYDFGSIKYRFNDPLVIGIAIAVVLSVLIVVIAITAVTVGIVGAVIKRRKRIH